MTNDPQSPDSPGLPRRDFLRLAGMAAGGLAFGRLSANPNAVDDDVPAPQFSSEWRKTLWEKGERAVYRGKDLRYIGLPIGGICAGHVYLGGDGRLWLWDITNQIKIGAIVKNVEYRGASFASCGGSSYIEPPEQVHPFAQGFAVRVTTPSGTSVRTMDSEGWGDVAFSGEYPMGFVEYRDPATPVRVSLEAFSPFIPLDAEDSGLPATLMRFTVRNDGKEAATVAIGGWLENAAGYRTMQVGEAIRRTTWTSGESRLDFELAIPERESRPIRPPIVFEDFEKETYEGWTVEGTAFGLGPRHRSKIAPHQGNVGGLGDRVVNSHNTLNGEDSVKADHHLGRLLSREFTIERRFIEFFIGGGNHPGKTCVSLLVDGKVVRTVPGPQSDAMRLTNFSVEDLEGKRARIEILDNETGPWGQIACDHIVFTDEVTEVAIHDRGDYGGMSLGFLDAKAGDWATHGLPKDPTAKALFVTPLRADGQTIEAPLNVPIVSGLVRELTLAPGKSETVTFVVAWRFPNLTLDRIGDVGNHYATRFDSSAAVVRHIVKNGDRLVGLTKRWHETWYDSTLPHWFLDRTMANTSTLASMTCVRFANGRFYAWEGVGSCDGTCGHVWQYAQAVGRLFPSLERSTREMCDYKLGVGFRESGLIDFRGEYNFGYAADSQAGYILRTYREHQASANDAFLRRVWAPAKKALEYLIEQDADDDGILEGRQHNTLDADLYGPSSWLSSLYLAALRAGEEMAKEMGDTAFATRCRTLFDRGSGRFTDLFWNGEYFIQRLNVREHLEALRYGNGCEIDQLMGQGWACQLGLGRIAEAGKSKQALQALYKHNTLQDVGPFRDKYKPGRWYAMPGESGMLLCSFPKGDRDRMLGPQPVWAHMYFNECWTGCEYQAAGHMVAEGLVEEGMTVTRLVHDRHHPSKRNPYNEIECGDHYARGMASYGVFLSACGYEYHGPKGHLGFAPKVNPRDFRAPFTAAEGWGTFSQRHQGDKFEAKVFVRHGRLRLKTIALEIPRGARRPVVSLRGQKLDATVTENGSRVTYTLRNEVVLKENETLEFA